MMIHAGVPAGIPRQGMWETLRSWGDTAARHWPHGLAGPWTRACTRWRFMPTVTRRIRRFIA